LQDGAFYGIIASKIKKGFFMTLDFGFLVNSAYAQVADEAAKQPSMIASMLPIVMIIGVFYFLIIRPQSKKLKEHQTMLSAVAKGDQVITSGGIFGTVVRIEKDNNIIFVEIAETVRIKVRQDAIAEIIKDKPAVA
jgi:preprotein translocase subunit YajC